MVNNVEYPSKMQVLFFLGFPLPFPGAAWTRIQFMAKHFACKGIRSTILGIFTPATLNKALICRDQSYQIMNSCPAICSLWGFAFNVISSMMTSLLLILIKKPTHVIISAPSLLNEQLIGVFVASKMYGSKIIFDYRDSWEDYKIVRASSQFHRLFYKILKGVTTSIYSRSTLVVTVTTSLLEYLQEMGVKNVKLVPNGADVTIFKPYDRSAIRKKLELNPDDFIIVYSGVVGEYYRLDIFVKALAKMCRSVKNVKLLIIGNGTGLTLVLKLSSELGLDDKIVYLGVKNDKKEVAEILSSADVGLLPYDDNILWKMSVPAKFYEYCSCGLPVLATAHEDSLLAEFIKEYRIGIISPPMNEEKLAGAIYWMYQNRIFREAAGKRARLLIEEKFDRNKIANDFLNLLKTVD